MHIDMLIRIKNGYAIKLAQVNVSYSSLNIRILSLLLKLGYINSFTIISSRVVCVKLSYYKNQPAIRYLNLLSKSSNKIYLGLSELSNKTLNLRQNGFFILSTSKGILTDVEALYLKVGGEVLFEIN